MRHAVLARLTRVGADFVDFFAIGRLKPCLIRGSTDSQVPLKTCESVYCKRRGRDVKITIVIASACLRLLSWPSQTHKRRTNNNFGQMGVDVKSRRKEGRDSGHLVFSPILKASYERAACSSRCKWVTGLAFGDEWRASISKGPFCPTQVDLVYERALLLHLRVRQGDQTVSTVHYSAVRTRVYVTWL
ncbi:hypothetical protein RRG08_024742 [Elysia crispata]|uniref:Uncharacterized protein n=1 Tax=Elysia crispata TaxID=231223 RepID=A0AAE1CX15_9GAST|nr:hypothetical protein RRG08_024742 [Elysia crispata]